MGGTVVIPGPETVVLFGVAVPVLSMLFGVGGVLLGHLIAPPSQVPIGRRRTAGVIAAGVLMALAITIATGQRPLVVLGWSVGIGFSGITIFQTLGAGAARGVRNLAASAFEKASADDKGGAA